MADDDKKVNAVSSVFPTASDDTNTDDPWKEVRKEVTERYELLPQEIQDIVTGDDYQTHIFNIAKTQKLTYEEMGILEVETTMVLLGMVNPDNYRDELKTQLKKNDAEIDSLVSMVNDQVFAPVRMALTKVYSAQKEPEDYLAPVPTPVAQPTPTPSQSVPVSSAPLSATDRSVLEKSGVVITDTPTAAPAPTMPIGNRVDLLKNIENPPKAPSSIVADKLRTGGPAMTPSKTTDYSVAKPDTTVTLPPTRGTTDPYREPLE